MIIVFENDQSSSVKRQTELRLTQVQVPGFIEAAKQTDRREKLG